MCFVLLYICGVLWQLIFIIFLLSTDNVSYPNAPCGDVMDRWNVYVCIHPQPMFLPPPERSGLTPNVNIIVNHLQNWILWLRSKATHNLSVHKYNVFVKNALNPLVCIAIIRYWYWSSYLIDFFFSDCTLPCMVI